MVSEQWDISSKIVVNNRNRDIKSEENNLGETKEENDLTFIPY